MLHIKFQKRKRSISFLVGNEKEEEMKKHRVKGYLMKVPGRRAKVRVAGQLRKNPKR